MSHAYVSRADIKQYLGLDETDMEKFNDVLDTIAEAVSRAIDSACGRRFWTDEETRYYTPRRAGEIWVDDLLSVTSIKSDFDGDGTYETTWTVDTDYHLYPYNAALELKPYYRIERAPFGRYAFPMYQKAVQVVGTFGYWTEVPGPITQAALQLASRLFKRKDSPLGILGGSTFEAVRIATVDQDIKGLLAPYQLVVMA